MIERLNILLENNVIKREIYDEVLAVHKNIMTDLNLIESEAYDVALTHLAMALERVSEENIVESMDDGIYSQLHESEFINQAQDLTKKVVKQLKIEVPESEQQYLLLHFLNLIEKKGEEE